MALAQKRTDASVASLNTLLGTDIPPLPLLTEEEIEAEVDQIEWIANALERIDAAIPPDVDAPGAETAG